MQQIMEGKAKLLVPTQSKISKKLSVFFNPVMELNRSISVLLLKSLNQKAMQIGLPLAGTGVRGVRFLKELPSEIIKDIQFNDLNQTAIKIIKDNLKLNNIKNSKISNKDANLFILESKGFDYIDIDPFGSPNQFLSSSISRLSRNGILAVTATDTGALAGSFPKACKRKYWSTPQKNSTMHENGIRILIRKVQLIGADHDKALTPIYSYAKDHYYRLFFRCEKGKQKVDKLLNQHGMYNKTGPLWLGQLWNQKLAKKISKLYTKEDSTKTFLKTIAHESQINSIGYHNLPIICKQNKLKIIKQEKTVKKIKEKGYKVASTHFTPNSLRSDIPELKLIKILKQKYIK